MYPFQTWVISSLLKINRTSQKLCLELAHLSYRTKRHEAQFHMGPIVKPWQSPFTNATFGNKIIGKRNSLSKNPSFAIVNTWRFWLLNTQPYNPQTWNFLNSVESRILFLNDSVVKRNANMECEESLTIQILDEDFPFPEHELPHKVIVVFQLCAHTTKK